MGGRRQEEREAHHTCAGAQAPSFQSYSCLIHSQEAFPCVVMQGPYRALKKEGSKLKKADGRCQVGWEGECPQDMDGQLKMSNVSQSHPSLSLTGHAVQVLPWSTEPGTEAHGSTQGVLGPWGHVWRACVDRGLKQSKAKPWCCPWTIPNDCWLLLAGVLPSLLDLSPCQNPSVKARRQLVLG